MTLHTGQTMRSVIMWRGKDVALLDIAAGLRFETERAGGST